LPFSGSICEGGRTILASNSFDNSPENETHDDDLATSSGPEMSIAGLTRTHTIDAEGYDHAIGLVDATKADLEDTQASEEPVGPGPSGDTLSRHWSRKRLREEIARRKYAKWQEDKQRSSTDTVRPNAEGGTESREATNARQGKGSELAGRLRDKIASRTRGKDTPAKEKADYEIDILYENQRGAFFCGIPLYSAKSLLNFDPSGWQTSTFHDSPVNITNAQLPDPSWAWAWRTWYVDMSHDVDEEGWEYSFSFKQGFAWHGSHPWFHSFVRRRRWIRKRVKIRPIRTGKRDDMKAAHLLTAEYFTIRSKRTPSPDSVGNRTGADQSMYFSTFANGEESDEDPAEITDSLALMGALRKSRLDREKIAAIKNFLEHGEDEIYYLADRMDDIMGLFIYQTSRRQLQTLLLQALDAAVGDSDGSFDGAADNGDPAKRKADNLLKAVHAANVHINDQDYWSEIRTKADNLQSIKAPTESETLDATKPSGDPGKGLEIDEQSGSDIKHDIKGIPQEAHVSVEPGIKWNKTPGSPTQGKEKE